MKLVKYFFFLFCIIFLSLMSPQCFGDQSIKRPNVSGQFYPSSALQLSSTIDDLMRQVKISPYKEHIDIVIAPHAGYAYSGLIAAHSYKAVSQNKYKTIIILAPSHYWPSRGVSVGQFDGMQTPLGVVPVNKELSQKLIDSDDAFSFDPNAFQKEHSLEVQIPFLQKTFDAFDIVPVLMGQLEMSTMQSFAKALQEVIGERKDILIVVSTDLSHFHHDDVAKKKDLGTIQKIKNRQIDELWQGRCTDKEEMCGYVPVITSLLYAKNRQLENLDVLLYANSGDVTGDKERVVGYTSIVIYDDNGGTSQQSALNSSGSRVKPLSLEQKRQLMEIAKKTMHEYVKTGKKLEFKITDPRLKEREGAFVTIHKHGNLRGCIGNIIGQKALHLTVRDMAIAAATQDPRFSDLKPDELDEIDLEISVLSKPWQIKDVNEIELGKHGVIVSKGYLNYGVFLPQVATETGWSLEEFLSYLCSQKAHLPADAWKDPSTKIEIFTADVFSEEDIH